MGKGTGLGLSMVHGLAQQLGGGIRISSRLGVGTNVELWLPMATELPKPAPGNISSELTKVGDRGKALLVDDEDVVRTSTARILRDAGFEVVEAGSGEEALALVARILDVAVLITNHLMPSMNGTQLVRNARASRPALPCLIVSGYAEVDTIAPDLPRVPKPFRARELTDALAGLGV